MDGHFMIQEKDVFTWTVLGEHGRIFILIPDNEAQTYFALGFSWHLGPTILNTPVYSRLFQTA